MTGVTQNEIAAALKVSRSSVAAVLSNSPTARISKEVREQILEAAERMGYRPNRYAQIMRKGASGVIGIINFGGLQQMPIQKLMFAVRAVSQSRFEPMVHDVFWFADRGRLACDRMIEARVEGVLLMHPTLWFTQKHLDLLLKAGIPVVSIGGDHLKGITRFMSDKEQGFHDLTAHLLGLGCRRMTLLLGKDSSEKKAGLSWHATKASAGFKRALKRAGAERGVSGTVHVVHHAIRPPSEVEEMKIYQPGRQGMSEILNGGVLPDAVLCSNDNWALGALATCAEADIRVPADLAITGFENEPVGAVGLLPLTTVAHPIREIAQSAVGMLLDLVATRTPSEGRLITLPCRLLVRRSCGASLKGGFDPDAMHDEIEASHPSGAAAPL